MAEKEQDGPSLELPSLGFGRKRKKARASPDEPEATVETAPKPETGTDQEPVPEPAPEPEPEPDPTPPTVTAADAEPEAETPPRPLFAAEASDRTAEQMATAPAAVAAEPGSEPEQGEPEKPAREFRLPAIGGMPAAIVTGLLVGLLTVGLTWVSLRGCEVVQGTASCGGPGLFLLLAIMILMILLGSALLRAWDVPDPGSTSFLAVGLMAVISLLFLIDLLFNWWMIIAIPVVTVLTFVLSHWVTTAIIEPAKD